MRNILGICVVTAVVTLTLAHSALATENHNSSRSCRWGVSAITAETDAKWQHHKAIAALGLAKDIKLESKINADISLDYSGNAPTREQFAKLVDIFLAETKRDLMRSFDRKHLKRSEVGIKEEGVK